MDLMWRGYLLTMVGPPGFFAKDKQQKKMWFHAHALKTIYCYGLLFPPPDFSNTGFFEFPDFSNYFVGPLDFP